MEVSVFKIFISKRKELEWLNSLGKDGHLLLKIKDSKYYFEKNDNVYSYSIENLGFSSQSDLASDYYLNQSKKGIRPIIYDRNWVYFVSENDVFTQDSVALKRNAKHHFWKMLYYFFFGFCGCIVSGYQAFSFEFLKRIEQVGDGRITSSFVMSRSTNTLTALLNVLKKMGNYLIKIVNGYFRIWTNIFGENEPVIVIAVVAPITVVLLIFGAFHLDEYLHFRTSVRKLNDNNSKEIIQDAK